MRQDRYLCILDCYLSHRILSVIFVCKGSTKIRNKRRKSEKFLKRFLVSHILCTFAFSIGWSVLLHTLERIAPQAGANCSTGWSILLHRLEQITPQAGACCSTLWSMLLKKQEHTETLRRNITSSTILLNNFRKKKCTDCYSHFLSHTSHTSRT
jgi:hypothetical protein